MYNYVKTNQISIRNHISKEHADEIKARHRAGEKVNHLQQDYPYNVHTIRAITKFPDDFQGSPETVKMTTDEERRKYIPLIQSLYKKKKFGMVSIMVYLNHVEGVSFNKPFLKHYLTELDIDTSVHSFSDDKVEELYADYSTDYNMNRFIKKHGITQIGGINFFKRHGLYVRSMSDDNYEFYRKYHFNQEYFLNLDTADKNYFLGFVLADGHVSETGVSISLQARDKYILEKFVSSLDGGIEMLRDKIVMGKPQSCLLLSSKNFVKPLHDRGISRNKTKDLTYPDYIPEEFKWDFFRGFWDGDGTIGMYVSYEKQRWFVVKFALSVIGTESMIMGIRREIEKDLGIIGGLYRYDKNKGNLYDLRFTGKENVLTVARKLYNVCGPKLDRKYKILQRMEEYFNADKDRQNEIKEELIKERSIRKKQKENRSK